MVYWPLMLRGLGTKKLSPLNQALLAYGCCALLRKGIIYGDCGEMQRILGAMVGKFV